MSTQSQLEEEHLTDKMVADYLQAHPDFFQAHLDLLAELHVPHAVGNTVSLIERQVALLRDQLDRQNHQFLDLVQVGEENQQVNERIHELALELMQAVSVKDVVDILQERLCNGFGTDAVTIRLRQVPEQSMPEGLVEAMESDDPVLAAHRKTFNEQNPVCGRLDEAQMRHVFAACQVTVKSAALIPLGKEKLYGYLGLGSQDADHFHSTKETMFLRYLGGIASCALERAKHIAE